ncbi:MAG: DNA translocase FtsK, partial [Clostridia bacterium]|nr:DNA translocase FtsK [Clostridia bacterium]
YVQQQQQYVQQPYAQEMQPGSARQFDTMQQQAYEQNYRRPENGAQQGESVRQWQNDIATEAAAKGRKGRHSSKLFSTGRQPAVQDDTSRMSVFTGRQYDGLTTAPAASERKKRPYEKTADAQNAGQQTPPARTAFTMPVQNSGYTMQAPAGTEPAYAAADGSARDEKRSPDRSAAPDMTSTRREDPEPVYADDRGGKNRTGERTVREPAREPVDGSPAREPVRPARGPAAETPSEKAPETPADQENGSARAPRRDRAREPEQLSVPVVQPIGENAWKPELKLPPRRDVPEAEDEDSVWTPTNYYPPLITNLNMPEGNHENTEAEDEFRSRRLEETLASFHVQAKVTNVTHGPAISRFELELAPGTKVNKVTELGRDIAYGMEAVSVRIEAPIPGKSLVGVEVPNRKVSTVTLREVLQDDRMQKAKSILTVALGKDIAGTPIVCDLAKMPHMLIAGATGSGKSVCINAIINSLLYRAGPDEVKMILVDPKVVELQCYNGIPHLLIPVVNDPHKAAAALAWAVAEMMDRYDKFAARRVRSLDSYNEALGPGEKPMPRIVIIIDELADLMMVCKKDVEEYICRLTQLARAAGIHLIVATQRPSVDVITGLIKANIPSRIAFKTASSVDSRTILDRNGSESLLGNGDMLYLPTGAFAPTRIQGCYLSDGEVNRTVQQVRENNPSTYDPNILEKLEEMTQEKIEPAPDVLTGTAESTDSDRDLFDKSVEMAIADGQISTSTLQRRLKIGYSRAGRLTDELEERGIISQKDGSKPRKCLVTREQWEAIKKDAET